MNFNGSASQLHDLELRSERIDHWIKIAHQHILQLVQRKADAMVGDAIFFEVVGAYFFAPSALAPLDWVSYCYFMLLQSCEDDDERKALDRELMRDPQSTLVARGDVPLGAPAWYGGEEDESVSAMAA